MSAPASSSLPHTDLNHFLRQQRGAFRAAPQDGSTGVRLVMGNEAGDLDSLACAIAFSYLAHQRSPQEPTWFPLVQTNRQDFKLRPENQLALKACLIDEDNIISLDDWTQRQTETKDKAEIALVDHCKLAARWKDNVEVTAVIDHHNDENLYQSANPRIIVAPTECGSCASLVAKHFQAELSQAPIELSRLLISAISIDTHNLDPAVGKAKQVDNDSAALLVSKAGFGTTSLQPTENDKLLASLDTFHNALSKAKSDVSKLSTYDLIRRDYKFYENPGSNDSEQPWRVGLTSVPWSLKDWVERDGPEKFLVDCHKFSEDDQLDLLGLLTSNNSKKHGFKRQALLYAPAGSAAKRAAVRKVASAVEHMREQLDMQTSDHFAAVVNRDGPESEPFVVVWNQCNLKATRKQAAPAFKDACSQVQRPS